MKVLKVKLICYQQAILDQNVVQMFIQQAVGVYAMTIMSMKKLLVEVEIEQCFVLADKVKDTY